VYYIAYFADLLQVQRGEISDSISGCAGAGRAPEGAAGALNLPFICFAF